MEMSVNRADVERYAQSESERLKLEGESIIIGGSSWDEVKSKMDDLRMYIKSKKINGGDEYSIRMPVTDTMIAPPDC